MNIKLPRSTIFTVLMLLLSSVLFSTIKGLKRALGVNDSVTRTTGVFVLFFVFFGNSIAQTSSSGDAYSWSTPTAFIPSGVPGGNINVTVNHALTLNQNLTIGTGNYIFNQDVTDQPGVPNYNFNGNTAGGSLVIAAGTTTFGGVTNIGGAAFTLTVKSGATLILGTFGSTNTNFLIGNNVTINIEAGGAIIVYGNILNSNSNGKFYVNGLLQVYGNYSTDNGNLDIEGTGQFYTTGSMTTQGSGEIYGSGNDCTSNCSGASLGCGFSSGPNMGDSYSATILPQSQTVCANGTVSQLTFSTNAPGVTRQWQFSSSVGGNYTTIPSQTGVSYTPVNLTATTWYRVKYTSTDNQCSGDKYSAPVPVYIAGSTYTQSTSRQSVCQNSSFGPISVSAYGSNLSYQWYSNTTETNTGGTLITGETNNVYTPSSSAVGTLYYYCVIKSNSCPTGVNSAVSGVFLTKGGPAITTQPIAPTATCSGSGTQIMSVAASGTNLSYSWLKDGVAVANGGGIFGQETQTLTLTNPVAANAGRYTVLVSNNSCGTTTSNAVIVTVNALPTITGALNVCVGATTALAGSATANATTPWTSGMPSIATVSNTGVVSGVTSGTSIITYKNNNGCIITATVTVNSLPTAFTVTGGGAYCFGGTGVAVGLSNSTFGVSYQLQIGGSDIGAAVAGTGSVISFGPQTAAGNYTVIATNTITTCPVAMTGSVTIAVNALPIVAVNGPIEINCTNTTAALSGNGTATSNVTYAWSTADGTFSGAKDAITAIATTAGTYTLTVTKTDTGCFDSKTVIVTKNIPTNTWNGAWSTGSSPTSSQVIEFASNYNSTADLEGCSCQVNAGVNVVFKSVDSKSGHTLKITNQVEVLGTGTLTFENNASLVQVNDNAVNSGTITYKRTTPEILKTDYVYWSTPVADAKLEKIQTGTLYYSFNAAGPSWTRAYAGTTMITGLGYIVRGAGTWFDTGSVTLTPNFIGVPNNGVKTVGIVGDRSNLIGNPYPSALDADAFILANINTNALSNSLSGSLYFWTHKSAIKLATEIRPGTAGSGAYAYTSDDYATYNLTGGTAGNKINVGKDTDPANKPSGKIAAGQAFFAAATAAGGIATFNNSMRLDKDKEALDNSQFFKPGSATKSSKSIEKNRVWLNLTNAEGAFKQTLIGYITGATNEYEGAYDGDSFNGNAYIDFYSINKDKNLVVQGRALPFDDNDTVPLGYKTTIVGEFKIAIDEADGFLANKKIILEDKLLDKIHDLSEAAYTFTTEKGTFNDRFVLSYANKTLATEDFEAVENRVMITNKNKEVKISTPENQIESVFIYDTSGRQIYTKTKVDKDELLVTNLVMQNQVLIVKVVLQDKSVVTTKILY